MKGTGRNGTKEKCSHQTKITVMSDETRILWLHGYIYFIEYREMNVEHKIVRK